MLEYGTSGMSVMEMSHRSKDYQDIIDSAEALVRELMHVPDNLLTFRHSERLIIY